jgi:hypothetical protein
MLLLLNCPKCQNHLQGENNSKLFFCTPCNLVYDVGDSKPKRYDLFYVLPKIEREYPQMYFPFWQVCSQYKIMEDGEQGLNPQTRFFYIPAFFIKNISYFGDIGYYITMNNIDLRTGGRKDIPVFPGDRGLTDSIVYPMIYLYKDETTKRSNDAIEINIDHKEISVALIPFYRVKNDFYDSVIYWKYPSGALI